MIGRKQIFMGMAAAFAMLASSVFAADWKPDGPVKVQVAFGAGGSTDTLARIVAKSMEEATGWNIIVENKPGGGGVALFTSIAKSPPRGNVLGVGVNMPILVNLHKRGDQLPFDIDSFDYIGTISKAENALIAMADAPYDDVAGLAEYTKANGAVAVAFDALPQKLMMDLTAKATGAQFNMVSTEGGAEIMKLMLGGQAQLGFGSGEHFPQLEAGKVKVLAAMTADRLSYAPDIKTFQESGVDAYVEPFFYMATTKGTPEDAKAAIVEAFEAALASPAVVEVVRNLVKNDPLNLGPEGTKEMFIGGLDNVKVLFAE